MLCVCVVGWPPSLPSLASGRTAPGSQLARGQQELPDRDHAPTFWGQVAAAFRDNPLVIFELFNEPFPGSSQAKTSGERATRRCQRFRHTPRSLAPSLPRSLAPSLPRSLAV